jgi:hypothetical protein
VINDDDKEDLTPKIKTYLMHICPACGKTVDMSRRYCNCHASLIRATTTVSVNSPEVKPCNFESPGLNCSDCPEDCMYCASFGEPATNSAGYGGKDCRHKTTGKSKCYCCQSQVDLALGFGGVNFTTLFSEILAERRSKRNSGVDLDVAKEEAEEKNIYLEAADVMRHEMEKPVLNRINRKWERAG